MLHAPARVRSGSTPNVYLAPSALSPTTGLHVQEPSAFSSPHTIAKDCIVCSSGLFSGVPVHKAT